MKVLGFMTGTSLDGIDMAVIETDGETIHDLLQHDEYPIPDWVREPVLKATHDALEWPRDRDEPDSFEPARKAVTEYHIEALNRFAKAHDILLESLDLIGVHGQTVHHQRPQKGMIGRTVQLFDSQLFTKAIKRPLVYDFRSNDIAYGGEGAPLAPVYHRALAKRFGLKGDVVIVNLGGVANITVVRGDDLIALDTGPANGMMDLWMQKHQAGRYDKDGQLAAKGQIDPVGLETLLSHHYFQSPPPKSLDRYDFSLETINHLGLEDGLATLSAFTAQSLKAGIDITGAQPQHIVLCGGGRLNSHLVCQIQNLLAPAQVILAEDLGWRGGAIEAEAFAYLAARSYMGLPISYPTTTGVPKALTGGLFRPE